ncbi:MAG: tripartite tricarboxylate transporter substrate binding protein, partial [Betaproteobacteria bacterium]|nr:tripartite tricarboxylate transporter substrate binding protein [Betaproteobacteria bacterium]
YKGGAPALTDLIAGRVALLVGNLGFFGPYEKEGKLKIIAAMDDKRMPERPDLPTVSESGVPGYSGSAWSALVAPAGTPAGVLDRIRADVVKILRTPEFNEKFMKVHGYRPEGNSREDFAAMLRTEYAHWGRIVKATGAKLD